jgi:hypothetical protein
VITIGRQSFDVRPWARCLAGYSGPVGEGFCESALLALGATSVESVDYSDYEDATYVADLNVPYAHPKTYDSVFDFGSTEHIFDVASVFRNIIGLCGVGGTIVHVLPVNNLSGHGFYQFCSDLMFDLYSARNGFDETEVFYASSMEDRFWYRTPVLAPGTRLEFVSIEPIVLVCIARKARDVDTLDVQQAYCQELWTDTGKPVVRAVERNRLAGVKALLRRMWGYRHVRNAILVARLATGTGRYSLRRKGFTKVEVVDLFGGRACG